jgi:hypothetical protein
LAILSPYRLHEFYTRLGPPGAVLAGTRLQRVRSWRGRLVTKVAVRVQDLAHVVRATLTSGPVWKTRSIALGLWRTEMIRVQAAGAPTEPLDFLDPYERLRPIVTSCIEYAQGGEPWEATWPLVENFEISRAEALQFRTDCKRFFDRAVAEMGDSTAKPL